MKKTLWINLIVIFLIAISCGDPSYETPDDLAKSVFHALKSNDFSVFIKCNLNVNDEKKLLVKVKSQTKLTEKQTEKVNKRMEKLGKNFSLRTKDKKNFFDDVLKEAKDTGIEWGETIFSKSEYKIRDGNLIGGIQGKITDIHFFIKFKEKSYEIELDTCFKLDRGWVIVGCIHWRGAED